MITFFLLGALLAAITVGVLTRPFWQRAGDSPSEQSPTLAQLRQQLNQLQLLHEAGTLGAAAYQDARATLERRLVDTVVAAAPDATPRSWPAAARRSIVVLSLIVVGVALAGYAWLGTPQALQAPDAEPFASASGAHAVTEDQIGSMIERLAARLKQNPEDAAGWAMLARSYAVLGRHEQALPAFAKATQLSADDVSLLADYADALAVTNGRSLEGEPARLIARALALDPSHLKVLSLAGTLAFERKNYATAIRHWEQMVRQEPQSELTQQIRGGLDDARMHLSGAAPATPTTPAAPAATAAKAAPGAASVSGTVSLAPALAAKTRPDDTVFVFARAAEGARMPLAIVRKQVRDLPLAFTLDDSQAMTPASRLSSAERVIVGARVSRSGDATPQPGDLQGFSVAVAPGASALKIEIAEVVAVR